MRHLYDAHIHTAFARNPRFDRQRTLLFVTPSENIPDRLRYAIERELPSVSIVVANSVSAASASCPDIVSLILIAPVYLKDMEGASADIVRRHPLALTAVMDEGPTMSASLVQDIKASKLVRGVLPMNLKLDVLLPIIALMMRGGEYYPKQFFDTLASTSKTIPEVRIGVQNARPMSTGGGMDYLSYLTKRETQILALVSRGLQNKSIAAKLHLSEHTVKIHLHNIITKLGTHNRTEAAAVFRDNHSGYAGTYQEVASLPQ